MAVLEMIFSQRDQRGRLIVTATCWVPQIFPSTCCWNPSQRDGDFCQGPLNESVASALRLQLQCLGLFNDVLMAWLYYLSAAQTTLNTPWPINPASTKKNIQLDRKCLNQDLPASFHAKYKKSKAIKLQERKYSFFDET